MILPINIGQMQELLPDVIGLGHIAEDDVQVLRGGFDADIAVIEKCREETMHIRSHILNPEQVKLGNSAGKEAKLLHINNAVVRDNPNVQIIINKVHEKEEMDAQIVDARGEDSDGVELVIIEQCWEAGDSDKINEHRQGQKQQKQANLRQES